MRSNTGDLIRTLTVFLGGVLLALVSGGVLDQMLNPDGQQWIVKAFTMRGKTPPTSPEWAEVWQHLDRAGKISVYLVSPLVGLVVGIFVGIFEKRRVLLVAASCLIPDLLRALLPNHPMVWAHSFVGILRFASERALPFATAIVAAGCCRHLVSSTRSPLHSSSGLESS